MKSLETELSNKINSIDLSNKKSNYNLLLDLFNHGVASVQPKNILDKFLFVNKKEITIKENETFITLEKKQINNIIFGKIPIIVNSNYCVLKNKGFDEECPFDPGGYAIINGNEKVIISQERIANNIAQVFLNPKSNTKYSYLC